MKAVVFCRTVCVVVLCSFVMGEISDCDKRPLETKAPALPPDNRFVIDVEGVGKEYIPDTTYTVILKARDGHSTFIAFTISAKEDSMANEKNPRKPIPLDTGKILPSLDGIAKPNCSNTVIQADVTPKKIVKAEWKAPPKNNKCVTIYALVAVKKDVWYDLDGPLSKRICEDRRKNEDMLPLINDHKCYICEDARYQLTFQGTWSYNTHPLMFPAHHELARFSDVVGASHNNAFHLFKLNGDASEGLTMLAESGNTTQLEIEIQRDLGDSVRTVIKANGQSGTNMTAVSSFRATKNHHRVSLVAGLLPSPDWFLGVADFELCDINDGQWTKERSLNLYPLDAGTDSGLAFDSPNERTSPPQPISQANINRAVPKEEIRPFARLHFKLIRTYNNINCADENLTPSFGQNGEEDGSNSGSDMNFEEDRESQGQVTITVDEELVKDPDTDRDCPMTVWEEWLPCEGICLDGKRRGYHSRSRYHIVDGVVIGKYIENDQYTKEVPSQCLEDPNNVDFQAEECEEDCEVTTTPGALIPGEGWRQVI